MITNTIIGTIMITTIMTMRTAMAITTMDTATTAITITRPRTSAAPSRSGWR